MCKMSDWFNGLHEDHACILLLELWIHIEEEEIMIVRVRCPQCGEEIEEDIDIEPLHNEGWE